MSSSVQAQTKDKAFNHPENPITGQWIKVDGSNPNTYKSSNLRSFLWSEDSTYEHGKLLIRFQESGLYVYDMPKHIFMKMANRAFEPENYQYTTGEWYSNKFFKYAKKIHGYKDNYYINIIDM